MNPDWSIFTCRKLVNFQLPLTSTSRRRPEISSSVIPQHGHQFGFVLAGVARWSPPLCPCGWMAWWRKRYVGHDIAESKGRYVL